MRNDYPRRAYCSGERHHRARLTDAEIDLLRNMRDDGMKYRELAAVFEIPKSTVASICQCRRRAITPA